MAGSPKRVNDDSASLQGGKFLDQITDYQHRKKGSK
jgi:hypothetical protein